MIDRGRNPHVSRVTVPSHQLNTNSTNSKAEPEYMYSTYVCTCMYIHVLVRLTNTRMAIPDLFLNGQLRAVQPRLYGS